MLEKDIKLDNPKIKSFQSKVFGINLLLCVAAIIFKIVKYAILDIEFLKACDPAEETPGDCYLVNFVYWERQFENIVSIIVFLHWFSFYKFFADFPSMAVFTTTFSRAANEMISFMLGKGLENFRCSNRTCRLQ